MSWPADPSLSRATYAELTASRPEVIVLPWGATEAHNYHLPYATDTIQAEAVAQAAAARANQSGARVCVLPAVPFGVQTAQIDVPLNINMMPTTQLTVLRDIVHSLETQGFRKLIIVNGHGGNEFVPFIRQLYGEFKVRIVVTSWFRTVPASKYFDEPGDHAGQLETSVMLHVTPDLVRPLETAGPGTARRLNIPVLAEGWAWTQRGWLGTVTDDTGIGNPQGSTAERGAAYFEAVTGQLCRLFLDVAAFDESQAYTP